MRKQFKLPIGRFEGIEERLAHIAAEAYAVESARRITAVALDHGQEPAVISAILKYQTSNANGASSTTRSSISSAAGPFARGRATTWPICIRACRIHHG